MTQITLIKRALRLLGVLAPGESMPPAELQDGVQALQGMLGQWGTQSRTMYATTIQTFDLAADTPSYTIGSGGTFDIARPTFIERASLISNADPTQPIEHPIKVIDTAQLWQEYTLKSLTGGWPEVIYYERSFPLAKIWPHPIPDISTLDLKLYIRQRVTGFEQPATEYTFPDGYDDALAYNLALRLAPEFGVAPSQDIKDLAAETLGNIKRVNKQPPELRIGPEYDGRLSGAYNWRIDE